MSLKVSVIVTTFNQAPYIGDALSSVLAQTHKPFEVIVVDDGSTDETPNRIAPYHDRVRYIHQANQGVAASRNTGIRAATGDLLAFLDGDDLWDPEKLEIQVRVQKENSASGIIVTDGVSFDEAGVRAQSLFRHVHAAFEGSWPSITTQCYWNMIRRNLISTCTQIMIPAAVLRDVGLSDTRFKIGSDYDLYLRIAARYPITFVAKPLMRWRFLSSSASGPAQLRYLNWSVDIIRALKKQLGERPARDHREIRKRISQTVFEVAEAAYYYGRAGNRSWAARYLSRLLIDNPAHPSVAFFLAGLLLPQAFARILGRRAHRMVKARYDGS